MISEGAQKKLDAIQTLLNLKESVEKQLEDILGEPSPDFTGTLTPDITKKGCAECGSPSRHKKECSSVGKPTQPQTASKRKGRPTKPCCNSKGPAHFKWCKEKGGSGEPGRNKGTMEWQKLEREEQRHRPGAMSKTHFEQVKVATHHELPPDAIARNLGLTQKEVNRAVLARNYDEYVV